MTEPARASSKHPLMTLIQALPFCLEQHLLCKFLRHHCRHIAPSVQDQSTLMSASLGVLLRVFLAVRLLNDNACVCVFICIRIVRLL